MDELNKDPFANYYKPGEPDIAAKAYAWQTAIGLQVITIFLFINLMIRKNF